MCMLASVSRNSRVAGKCRCVGEKRGAELSGDGFPAQKRLIHTMCSLIVLLDWSATTVTLDGLDPSAAAAFSQQSCFPSAPWPSFKSELKSLTEGLLEWPWRRNTGIGIHFWIRLSKLGRVCRRRTKTCLMLMQLFRFDHEDWILRAGFSQGLLLQLPAFIYSKIHLVFLFPHEPRPLYFSLRLKISFAVRLYEEHKKKVTVISPNFSSKWDLRGWRPSLNTAWHHWVIGFHSWLQPKENRDQQGQLQACKDLSQCAGGINNRRGKEETLLKGRFNELFPAYLFY